MTSSRDNRGVATRDAWRDPDDIIDDFASGDAERVRLGITGLREFTRAGDEFPLPAINSSLLAPFGGAPPDETVIDLARIITSYRSFEPPRSRPEVIHDLVELAVRYAVPQVLYETSLAIQGEADPPAAATAAIAQIGQRGTAEREIRAAAKLVHYLLEAKLAVRRAAADALASWPASSAKREIVTAVLPLVEPDQRALFL